MSGKRPELAKAKLAFKKVYDDVGKPVSAVGTLIGGKVDFNINQLTPEQGKQFPVKVVIGIFIRL